MCTCVKILLLLHLIILFMWPNIIYITYYCITLFHRHTWTIFSTLFKNKKKFSKVWKDFEEHYCESLSCLEQAINRNLYLRMLPVFSIAWCHQPPGNKEDNQPHKRIFRGVFWQSQLRSQYEILHFQYEREWESFLMIPEPSFQVTQRVFPQISDITEQR